MNGRERRQRAEERARQTLVDHGLYAIPVNPVEVARALEIPVLGTVFSDRSVAGLSAKRSGRPAIFVKDDDHVLRKRFTVAHELGHCVLHLAGTLEEISDGDTDLLRTAEYDETWSPERIREFEANAFAAALLMPEEFVRKVWEQLRSGDRTVDSLARLFGVSREAMSLRLSALGIAR